jgi:putative transposase
MHLADREHSFRFLLHDRDSKFGGAFDEVFRSEGMRIIRTPIRAPNANAYAVRWVGTLRRECLDRILIVNRRHLEQVLRAYTAHYNRHRPHRSLSLQPPDQQPARPSPCQCGESTKHELLGGLINEYKAAA